MKEERYFYVPEADSRMELPQEEKKIKRSFKNYEIIDLEEYGSFKKAPIKINIIEKIIDVIFIFLIFISIFPILSPNLILT